MKIMSNEDNNDTSGGGGGVFNSEPKPSEEQDKTSISATDASVIPEDSSGSPVSGSSGTPEPKLTADEIAEAIKKAGIGQPAAAQPEKTYTQEDFDKAFQVFNPTPELISAITQGGDNALKAFIQLRDGLVRQAVTMASYIVQDQLEKYDSKLRPQFEPVQKYVNERQVKELYEEFYTKNKDLKPYDSVVQAAVQQLKAENASFKTKEEGFKATAERTRAILKTIPGISLAENGEEKGQPASKMPTLSRGGSGGLAKGPSGGSGAKDPSHSIFS